MALPKIYSHCSYIGDTGYNNHSRDFFRHLSKYCEIKIRNFTVGKSWKSFNSEPHNDETYFTEIDKNYYMNKSCGIQMVQGVISKFTKILKKNGNTI